MRRGFRMESATPSSSQSRRQRSGIPGWRELWTQPLPLLAGQPTIRTVCRVVTSLSRWQIREIHGLEHIAPERDPFILALNHSQRPEALVVPTWLCFHRRGRMVHFLADWNFFLVPVVGWVIRLHDPIVVVRKDAKPKFLNRFKERFRDHLSPFEEAQRRLGQGCSVGIFPEATTNRHPTELLRGQAGVARLAIDSRVPVVPGGIRFPEHRGGGPIQDRERFSVHFGEPLTPPVNPGDPGEAATIFHEQIMRAISTLSGKQWQPTSRRTKYAFAKA
ncbi:MAG: 1-acyl-sn-glycerol-3-phosphate acyltransferase [Verrucomicrobia bacterium]|nr:1-acyl-sn-glycerol-3-phosphate acyltransferase [Verrucomicrobiota bacterium]